MKTLRSYVRGNWHEAQGGFVKLVDPSTEEEIARASSEGIDFGAVLAYAREKGGPALRAMTFSQRSLLLKEMSKVLRDNRDELLDLSAKNTGTTKPDGSFDIDGGWGTLAYYFSIGRGLGERAFLSEGDGVQLAKTEGFYGRHILVPRHGVAVHINAFNFPVWGFAEKAACALLAGMPVITKPATATALVTERAIELIVAAGFLPEGALQLIVGSTGDLLDRLGPQDVLAFTGSARHGASLRRCSPWPQHRVRVNVEADSLNAAILGPDVAAGSANLGSVRQGRDPGDDPEDRPEVHGRAPHPGPRGPNRRHPGSSDRAGLIRWSWAIPRIPPSRMGPVATAQQLKDAEEGIAELAQAARIVHGRPRIDGAGAPEGKGFFLQPTLLRSDDARSAGPVHEREVFGPVATLLPYDGSAAEAAEISALGGGTLVTSAYTRRRRLGRTNSSPGAAAPPAASTSAPNPPPGTLPAREPPCRRPSTAARPRRRRRGAGRPRWG